MIVHQSRTGFDEPGQPNLVIRFRAIGTAPHFEARWPGPFQSSGGSRGNRAFARGAVTTPVTTTRPTSARKSASARDDIGFSGPREGNRDPMAILRDADRGDPLPGFR